MDLETVLDDLGDKIPCLRHILRPEYVPYLTTAATVFIGWLLVTWIFHLIWILITPLTISAIAIALICPATSKWCFQQLGTNLEEIMNNVIHKFQCR
ncbi:uncharacterized protein [Temnothorax nylanderi]|uniref:uncharacterized protein n=1 Tax=Temnothorax nylanderi TaxID=102681 RepID=UPI003A8525BF